LKKKPFSLASIMMSQPPFSHYHITNSSVHTESAEYREVIIGQINRGSHSRIRPSAGQADTINE